MINFDNRFHGHGSLRFVYKNGEAVRSRLMIIKSIQNKHRHNSRVAIVVSKKVVKGAVRRNRIRRRLYEHIRNKLSQMNGVYDIAVIVLSGELLTLPAHDLSVQVDQLLYQANIIK
jgi:ribonuclease P protein component